MRTSEFSGADLTNLLNEAAEEVIFGESEKTTGAVGDLQQITGLAKSTSNGRSRHYQDKAYEIALEHIRNNREAMDKIVEVLVEKETM
ncbi:unnamed protein product [Brassica napus]|uniref:(rape) hypothetical protein n=1 Tax=Brassica napus TaxID=3708 RepID=A0A816PUP4_BRANA|nr:unnamed protein product [Brassica napus]